MCVVSLLCLPTSGVIGSSSSCDVGSVNNPYFQYLFTVELHDQEGGLYQSTYVFLPEIHRPPLGGWVGANGRRERAARSVTILVSSRRALDFQFQFSRRAAGTAISLGVPCEAAH